MTPWTAAQIALVKTFCDERSFDLSYYPGIDVVAARAGLYNDLPAVNFESGEVASGAGSSDAVADEAGAVLRGEASSSQAAFNLQPITLDRPAFYSILRLGQVPNILKRIEILPQPEVGQLVNLTVLGQALLLAALVLVVPLFAPRVAGAGRPDVLRPVLYFGSLGLGFLFIEIVLIEKASLYLNDRTSAFALVLTGCWCSPAWAACWRNGWGGSASGPWPGSWCCGAQRPSQGWSRCCWAPSACPGRPGR